MLIGDFAAALFEEAGFKAEVNQAIGLVSRGHTLNSHDSTLPPPATRPSPLLDNTVSPAALEPARRPSPSPPPPLPMWICVEGW